MRKTYTIGLIAAATLLLAACGSDPGDRAATGAGVGAGTGAAVGAIFGGVGAIPGALIGGAVGAGTGAVTTPQQVNLGPVPWRQHASNDVNNPG